jgi:hypothetical protein
VSSRESLWFNINTANHGPAQGVVFLAPQISYIRNSLIRCGHTVTVVDNWLHRDAINLYLEHFPAELRVEEHLRQRREREPDLRIGIVATELMVGGTIPYMRHGISYRKAATGERVTLDADALTRQAESRVKGFEALLPHVDFTWCYFERTASTYRGRAKNCTYFPVGHAVEIPLEQRRAPKDIDVFFYGKATPHRLAVLDRLTRRGLNLVAVGDGMPSGWLPDFMASSLLDRAKIGLNLTLHARDDTVDGYDPRFVSPIRMTEMLEHEVCVVSEEIPIDNPYGNYMTTASIEALADVCHDVLRSGSWRERGPAAGAAFREAMDVRQLCAPIVERTCRLA